MPCGLAGDLIVVATKSLTDHNAALTSFIFDQNYATIFTGKLSMFARFDDRIC